MVSVWVRPEAGLQLSPGFTGLENGTEFESLCVTEVIGAMIQSKFHEESKIFTQ